MYSQMQAVIRSTFAVLIIAESIFAQIPQWTLLSSSPSPSASGRFEDIYFINEHTGWIINILGPSFKTTDGGSLWQQQNSLVQGSRSIGFFSSSTGIIGTLRPQTPLQRSTNGGFTYAPVTGLPNPQPEGICGISIVDSFTAVACGVYNGPAIALRTTDAGISWANIFNDSSLARTLIDCHFWSADSGIMVGGYNTTSYSNGYAVVLKTIDGGQTWQRKYLGTRSQEWCWKICFVTKDLAYVSIERQTGMSFILKTTNRGDSWNEIQFRVYDQEGIGFVNENTGWVWGWSGPTYMTTNGGLNWQLAGWGILLNRFRFLSDTLAYAAGDRVYKYSTDQTSVKYLSNEVPSEFKLYQNFPNPFNPETAIRFDANESGRYELKILDICGREVMKLVNSELRHGTYEAGFGTANVSSGVYFAVLTGPHTRMSIKMLVSK